MNRLIRSRSRCVSLLCRPRFSTAASVLTEPMAAKLEQEQQQPEQRQQEQQKQQEQQHISVENSEPTIDTDVLEKAAHSINFEDTPTTQMHLFYTKIKAKSVPYVTIKSESNHLYKWTATAHCPIYNIRVPSGGLQDKRSVRFSDGNLYYQEKKSCVHAAAGRLMDSLHYEFTGRDNPRYCIEDPVGMDHWVRWMEQERERSEEKERTYVNGDDGDDNSDMSNVKHTDYSWVDDEFDTEKGDIVVLNDVDTASTHDDDHYEIIEMLSPEHKHTYKSVPASAKARVASIVKRAEVFIAKRNRSTKKEGVIVVNKGNTNKADEARSLLHSLSVAVRQLYLDDEDDDEDKNNNNNNNKNERDEKSRYHLLGMKLLIIMSADGITDEDIACFIHLFSTKSKAEASVAAERFLASTTASPKYPVPGMKTMNALIQLHALRSGSEGRYENVGRSFMPEYESFIALASSASYVNGTNNKVFDSAFALTCVKELKMMKSKGALIPEMHRFYTAVLPWCGGANYSNVRPNARNYSWSYVYSKGTGSLSAVNNLKAVEEVLRHIVQNGDADSVLDPVFIEAHIQALARTKSKAHLDVACKYAKGLLERKDVSTRLSLQTFHPILYHLFRHNEEEKVMTVQDFITMLESHSNKAVHPDGRVYSRLVEVSKNCANTSAAAVERSIETCNSVITKFCDEIDSGSSAAFLYDWGIFSDHLEVLTMRTNVTDAEASDFIEETLLSMEETMQRFEAALLKVKTDVSVAIADTDGNTCSYKDFLELAISTRVPHFYHTYLYRVQKLILDQAWKNGNKNIVVLNDYTLLLIEKTIRRYIEMMMIRVDTSVPDLSRRLDIVNCDGFDYHRKDDEKTWQDITSVINDLLTTIVLRTESTSGVLNLIALQKSLLKPLVVVESNSSVLNIAISDLKVKLARNGRLAPPSPVTLSGREKRKYMHPILKSHTTNATVVSTYKPKPAGVSDDIMFASAQSSQELVESILSRKTLEQ